MKLFGSITELLQLVLRKDTKAITVRPNQTITYTADRDIQLPPQDADAVLVSQSATQTLTDKTVDGDDNTVQDLALSSMKTVAGDANKVVRRDGSGVVVSGNSIPNSSALVTTDASQTLTGKTIDGDNNTIQDVGISSLKTVLADADTAIVRDAGGAVVSAKIADANVSATAGIAATKIGAGTVDNTEFGHLDGVTSGIQSQLNGKQATITGAATTITSSDLSASKALQSDASGKVAASSVTSTELGYVSGVTSAIQTQLGNKAASGANSDITSLSGLTTALSIGQGGTGQTTANAALNALLPSQSGNANRYLKSDGTNTSWATAGGGTGVNYLSDWYDGTRTISVSATTLAATANRTTDQTLWARSTVAGLTIENNTVGPLRPLGDFLVNSSATTINSFVESPLFSLDQADLGKAISVQFDITGVAASTSYDVVVVRYNSSGTYQETISVAGTASTGTPASAQLPTGTKTFNGFFIPSSTSDDKYGLRLRKVAAIDDDFQIDSLVVGPNQVLQGAIVTDWVDGGTITITGTTTNPTKGTVVQDKWWYRQVGDSYEFRMEYSQSTAGTGGSGQYLFTLPAGLAIDTTKIQSLSTIDPAVLGSAITRGGANYYVGVVTTAATAGTSSQIRINLHTTTSSAVGAGNNGLDSNPCRYYAEFRAPIAGKVANTQQAARAVEEYAADDGSADVFGPNGAPVPNLASSGSAVGRTFKWQQPVLATDSFVLELSVSTGRPFLPAATLYPYVWGNNGNTLNQYGLKLVYEIATAEFNVEFGGRGTRVSASNVDAADQTWASVFAAGGRFRVRKVSGGAAVGYPVGARNVIGDTTGTAVPAGYIGETITAGGTTNITPSTTTNLTTQVLKPGVWLITAQYTIDNNAAFNFIALSISTSSANLDGVYYVKSSGSGQWGGASVSRVVNISSDTTYYTVGYSDAANGTRTSRFMTTFVRIA